MKRKSETQADQFGRKPKRLRMERLEGWGIGTTQVEELEDGGDSHLEDWKEITISLPWEKILKRKQTSIQDWTGKKARIEENTSPLEGGTSHFSSHEDQKHTNNINISERCSSALRPPISNWTTHEGPSGFQLNTLQNTPSSRSSVKATNCVEPNVEIVR